MLVLPIILKLLIVVRGRLQARAEYHLRTPDQCCQVLVLIRTLERVPRVRDVIGTVLYQRLDVSALVR